MPGDAARNLPEDNLRIRAWREERLKVAEEQKQERLRKRDEARRMLELERKRLKRETARSLLSETDDAAQLTQEHAVAARRNALRTVGQFISLVLLPVAIAAWYLTAVATPLYEARAVISITPGGTEDTAQPAGLLPGLSGRADLQEVFMAHEFIQSQGLLDFLESETGFVSRYSGETMDPLRRLYALPRSGLDQRRQSARFLNSSVDVQSGLLTLYVRGVTPEEAVETAELVLARTGLQINSLIDQMHTERIALAKATLSEAESRMVEAQAAVIKLQIEGGEVDPQLRVVSLYQAIDALEGEARKLDTDLQKAEFSGMTDTVAARQTATLRSNVEAEIERLRGLLVAPVGTTGLAMNALVVAFERARLELRIAEDAVAGALAALNKTEAVAALGKSQFQVVVAPQTGPAPRYPQIPGVLGTVFIICLTIFGFWRLVSAGRRSL